MATLEQSKKDRVMILANKVEFTTKIFDSLFDIILITNEEKYIVDSNAAVSYLGYEQSELELQSIFMLSFDNSKLQECFDNLANGHIEYRKILLSHKDGSTLWFEAFARKVTIENDNFYVVMFHNINAEQQAREQIEKTTRQLQDANKKLESRQHDIEIELAKEKDYRLREHKTGFQRSLSRWLLILIGMTVVAPYLTMIFIDIPSEITNNTFNITILLVNGILLILQALFQTENKEGDKNKMEIKK